MCLLFTELFVIYVCLYGLSLRAFSGHAEPQGVKRSVLLECEARTQTRSRSWCAQSHFGVLRYPCAGAGIEFSRVKPFANEFYDEGIANSYLPLNRLKFRKNSPFKRLKGLFVKSFADSVGNANLYLPLKRLKNEVTLQTSERFVCEIFRVWVLR